MAGVKAAATLFNGGVQNFVVLEQSDRIGGRLWNTEWQDQTIELGANWIEGIPQNENPIWTIAEEIGLHGNYTMQEGSPVEPVLYDIHGRVRKGEAAGLHERLRNALNGAMNISCMQHQSGLGDVTLREALSMAGWPPMERQSPLERTLEFFVVDWDFEFPPENVSLFNYFDVGKVDSWREACRHGGGLKHAKRSRSAARMGMLSGFSWEAPRYFVTDARGYAAVAEHVANTSFMGPKAVRQASDQSGCLTPRLLFNKTVTHIRYGGDSKANSVQVETADGQVYSAKRAIVTFSSGVVNAAIRDGKLFHPALPDWKASAFAKTDPGVYTKIFARYSEKFWDNADYVLFAHPTRRGSFAVWQDMESHGKFFPSNANILMVTLVQADSRRVELQSKEETVAELEAALKMMYGPDVPKPIDIFIPKWYSNEFFRGSWSNIAIGTTSKDFDAMQRAVGNLYFAGEATDADYNGFVLGGYHSGEAVAKRVLEDMRPRGIRVSAADTADAYPAHGFWHSSYPQVYLLIPVVTVTLIGAALLTFFFSAKVRHPLGADMEHRLGLTAPMLPELRYD